MAIKPPDEHPGDTPAEPADLDLDEDADVKARPVGSFPRLGLVAMKHGPAAEIADHLLDLHEDVRALMTTEKGRAEVACTLLRRLGPELETTMLTYAQKLKKEGYDQGRDEGIEQGQRTFLRRLLEQRFGVLPGSIIRRVEEASSDDIERWGTRILSADSLDQVCAP